LPNSFPVYDSAIAAARQHDGSLGRYRFFDNSTRASGQFALNTAGIGRNSCSSWTLFPQTLKLASPGAGLTLLLQAVRCFGGVGGFDNSQHSPEKLITK